MDGDDGTWSPPATAQAAAGATYQPGGALGEGPSRRGSHASFVRVALDRPGNPGWARQIRKRSCLESGWIGNGSVSWFGFSCRVEEGLDARQPPGAQQDGRVADVVVVTSLQGAPSRLQKGRLGPQDLGDGRQPFLVAVLDDPEGLGRLADGPCREDQPVPSGDELL